MQRSIWSPFAALLPPAQRNITKLMYSDGTDGGFESYPAADRERSRRAVRLARSSLQEASAVAARLLACVRDDRCLSPACPVCVGRTRIWFYREIARVLDFQ